MANPKEKMLQHIQKNLGRGELSASEKAALKARMKAHPRGILPARAHLKGEALIELFMQQARFALAKIEKIKSLQVIPEHIATILNAHQLPLVARISGDLVALSWDAAQVLVAPGRAVESDKLSVSTAFCGVAETGTLVMLSSPITPTTLNFLPEIHVVLLGTQHILSYYEDAWDLIRKSNLNPRVVNFITGPSRTGDIEQTVQIGVHGPKVLYIFIVEEDKLT